jgi:hypothetical protein
MRVCQKASHDPPIRSFGALIADIRMDTEWNYLSERGADTHSVSAFPLEGLTFSNPSICTVCVAEGNKYAMIYPRS